MDAKTAHAIAKDAKAIKKFKEKMDARIERVARNGEFYAQDYISWSVSDEAVLAMAKEYDSQGFEYVIEARDEAKISQMSCDNYSARLIKIYWEKG